MNPLASIKSAGLYILGILAAVLSIFFAGRKAGADAVNVKQAEKSVKQSKKANEIRDKNTVADESDIVHRLRKYQRK